MRSKWLAGTREGRYEYKWEVSVLLRLHRTNKIASALICFICSVWAAGAQQGPGEFPSEPFYRRFSFGGRGCVLFFNLMERQTIAKSSSTSDPPLSITNSSSSASKRYSGGPTLHFRVTDRAAVNVDFIYRRAGYDAENIVMTQGTEDETGDFISGEYERTRADYWDVPILARYYNKGPDEDGMRAYIAGGLTLRTVSGIKSFWQTIDEDGLSDTNSVPVRPAKKNVQGAVVGAGLQFRDEVGLKIELEVRYTRWLGRIFESGPTRANVNQGEFVLGLRF